MKPSEGTCAGEVAPRADAAPRSASGLVRRIGALRSWALPSLVLAWLVVSVGAGASRPLEEHEVLVARTATEMRRDGEILVPRFNGAPRLAKPPLSYWLAMASHASLGGEREDVVGERAARLPSALAALALIAVVYALARAAHGTATAGWIAAAAWGTSIACFQYARNARPEMVFALACGLAMLGFVRMLERREILGRHRWLAWGGVALAILAKGPLIPLVLVGAAGAAAALAARRDPGSPRALDVLNPRLAGLAFAPVAIYFVLVAARVPGGWALWSREMFDRTDSSGSTLRGFLTFPYAWKTLPLLGPWIVLVPAAIGLAARSRPSLRALLLGFLAVGLFLGLGRRTHAYYALPVIPLACAALGAGAADLRERLRGSGGERAWLRAFAGMGALGACGVGAAIVAAGTPLASWAMLAAVLGLAAAAAAWTTSRRFATSGALSVAGFALVLVAAGSVNLGSEAERFTKAEFARELGRRVPAEVPLARLSGSLELVVHYADRRVDDVEVAGLPEWIASHPGGLVLARGADVEAGRIDGEPRLVERSPDRRSRMVLLAPSRVPPSALRASLGGRRPEPAPPPLLQSR